MDQFLELQRLQPNEGEYHLTADTHATLMIYLDVVLSLVDMKGNPSLARLSVRVTRDSTSTVAGDAVEQAQASAQKLIGPVVVAAVSDISDTVSNQQNLIAPFEALMKKLGVLVKIGDEVAKVCSSVSPLSHDLS